MILTSQTSTRGPIVGHEARNLDAQRTFLNTFENIVNRRVNIPEDIRRFQKTLQYARSKVDYMIGEFIYMLPSDMNLRIGNIRNYNNKILISSPSFKIGTNVKINLLSSENRRLNENDKQLKLKDKPDAKSKEVDNRRLMVKSEPDVKQKKEPDVKSYIDVKPNIELKHDIKVVRTKPDMNEITIEPSLVELNNYEEEKVALVLGITSVFTVWWMFK